MKPFKYQIATILLFITLLTFSSCKKEEINPTYSIRYELESGYHWNVLIQWTDYDGGIHGSSVEDSGWEIIDPDNFSYSFETDKELKLYYKGQNTNSLSDVKIRLYVNDSLVQSAEANSQMEAIINYQL